MRKIFFIALTILFLATGCAKIDRAELDPAVMDVEPEPTPTATPQPSPTPPPIHTPETIADLSTVVGMPVFAPSEPLSGMSLSSIGYDGKKVGALKYSNGTNTLLYTFCVGLEEDAQERSRMVAYVVSGIKTYIACTSTGYTAALWQKGGATYRLYCEPGLTLDDIKAAVDAMVNVPRTGAESPDAATVEELSSIVGFSVQMPAIIPEGYALVDMYAYEGETPRIEYSNSELIITFTKCEGAIYPRRLLQNELPATDPADIGAITVLNYYTENGIALAEWINGDYGYAITVTDMRGNPMDLPRETMLQLAEGFLGC